MFCTLSRSEQECTFFITFLQSSASECESSCTVKFAARDKLHGYKAYFHTDDQIQLRSCAGLRKKRFRWFLTITSAGLKAVLRLIAKCHCGEIVASGKTKCGNYQPWLE